MFDFLKNLFFYRNRYRTNSEAVIISCYFNPENSAYRLEAFNKYYKSIKHLNHRIIECVIGDGVAQLPVNDNIKVVHTTNLLWHKEALLNSIIKTLPAKFKYVFWVDADVLFTNLNWLTDGVKALKTKNIIQPFEYCVHLERDELEPHFDLENQKNRIAAGNAPYMKVWRSACANYATTTYSNSTNYDKHGHVGFAWAAKREILDVMPLYDHALIGGADHIMFHAAAGHIPHACIINGFKDDLPAILEWSRRFAQLIAGQIGFVKGDLYHIWHGDVEKREYLKRVQEFTPKTKNITEKDNNGLYVTKDADDKYITDYFKKREVPSNVKPNINLTKQKIINTTKPYSTQVKLRNVANRIASNSSYGAYNTGNYIDDTDDSFLTSVIAGFATDSTLDVTLIGGNLMGALVGEEIRDLIDGDTTPSNQIEFGGGSSRGGGATGTWDDTTTNFS